MINNKEKNFISAVIYIHNNEKEIGNFLEKVNRKLSENFEKYEIICVDDHSTDNSVKEIKKVADNISGTIVSIINMSYYQGIELTMNAGVDLSIGDFVYEFDMLFLLKIQDLINLRFFPLILSFDLLFLQSLHLFLHFANLYFVHECYILLVLVF